MSEELVNEYQHGPQRKYCKRGHLLSEDNVRYVKGGIRNGKQRYNWVCMKCKQIESRRYYNPEYYRRVEVINIRASRRLKNERGRASRYWQIILNHYGAYCHCNGCDITERDFLTLEHLKGNGTDHRRRRNSSAAVYKDVIDAGFPKDEYTILCMNCNWARRRGRKCPHEVEAISLNVLALAGAC